jgi:hypothetical protein
VDEQLVGRLVVDAVAGPKAGLASGAEVDGVVGLRLERIEGHVVARPGVARGLPQGHRALRPQQAVGRRAVLLEGPEEGVERDALVAVHRVGDVDQRHVLAGICEQVRRDQRQATGAQDGELPSHVGIFSNCAVRLNGPPLDSTCTRTVPGYMF